MEAKININMQVCLDFGSRKMKNKPFSIRSAVNGVGFYDIKTLSFAYFNTIALECVRFKREQQRRRD